MSYATEIYPYDRPLGDLPPGELKRGFASVMEQVPKRISNIAEFLRQAGSPSFIVSASDSELDQLPDFLATLCHLRMLSDEEFESRLLRTRPAAVEVMRAVLPRQTLETESYSMVFDAALLWGEVFRFRYPGAKWAIGAKPKSSIDFGGPVLIGVDQFHTQFNPIREMIGHVGRLMLGMFDEWTLSKLMIMRAFSLGLGPDPRPGPMSDWEKKRRGIA